MTVIPYTKQTWADGSSSTPLSAARQTVLENGIFDVSFAPAVRVYHNTTQSINNTTETALAFNSERFDQVSNAASTMHDTVTNNSRLTCQYAGVYAIFGQWNWTNSAAGSVRRGSIRVGGATVIAMQSAVPLNGVFGQSVSTIYSLAVNDYVELVVYQDSGGGLNMLSTGNNTPEFGMVRVG